MLRFYPLLILLALFFIFSLDISYSHEINDNLMRFFDQCKKFIEDVENNKTALQEVDLFKSSDEMKNVQRRIADRLQIPHSHMTSGSK